MSYAIASASTDAPDWPFVCRIRWNRYWLSLILFLLRTGQYFIYTIYSIFDLLLLWNILKVTFKPYFSNLWLSLLMWRDHITFFLNELVSHTDRQVFDLHSICHTFISVVQIFKDNSCFISISNIFIRYLNLHLG